MSDAEIILAERERASNRVEKLQRDHAKERLELISSMMETVFQRDERVADLLHKMEEKDRLRHSEVSAARAEVDQARKRIAQLEREAELQVLENARKRKLETETHEVQVRGLEESKQALEERMVERVSAFELTIKSLEERLANQKVALDIQTNLAAESQQKAEQLSMEIADCLERSAEESAAYKQKFADLENNSVEILANQRKEKNKAVAKAEQVAQQMRETKEAVHPVLSAFDELRTVSLLRRPFTKITRYKSLLQALLKTSDALRT